MSHALRLGSQPARRSIMIAIYAVMGPLALVALLIGTLAPVTSASGLAANHAVHVAALAFAALIIGLFLPLRSPEFLALGLAVVIVMIGDIIALTRNEIDYGRMLAAHDRAFAPGTAYSLSARECTMILTRDDLAAVTISTADHAPAFVRTPAWPDALRLAKLCPGPVSVTVQTHR
jgi:hypothetical protein